MNTKDFYYYLPEKLIAQTPVFPRDSSKMLVMDKKSGKLLHKHFYEIIDFLDEKDCLVINDSRVLPARIFGAPVDSEGVCPEKKQVEFLLLKQKEENIWEALAKPGKKAKTGAKFSFLGKNSKTDKDSSLIMDAEVIDVLEDGNRIIKFSYSNGTFFENLDKIGQMPLPPYIKETLKDNNRYQTVYCNELGSSAAPTAGLHFTNELLNKLEEKGVKVCKVTLHVGLGTFRPVKADKIEEHKMHSEYYSVPKETADIINETKNNGGRVIAVGTTSCRTLESVAAKHGKIIETSGDTNIFIYPGYSFKILDGLVTNFHLPESTLIMLVSAFSGYENTMQAYKTAVEDKYRFFSFGDSMLIL